MALDEVGHCSCDLAREIRRQLEVPRGYIDIEQIASALDIVEIRHAPLTSFEGALLTDQERSWGSILVNSASGPTRGRFTIAHELLHFLNDRHVQIEGRFQCTARDIGGNQNASKPGASQHRRQEAEANRFAIELLAPKASFTTYLVEPADLAQVRDIARQLRLSKEATARRYLELHSARIALVFHHMGSVRYVDKQDDFPFLPLRRGSPLPTASDSTRNDGTLTTKTEGDPRDWFDGPPMSALWVQSLHQSNGHGITMLELGRRTDGI